MPHLMPAPPRPGNAANQTPALPPPQPPNTPAPTIPGGPPPLRRPDQNGATLTGVIAEFEPALSDDFADDSARYIGETKRTAVVLERETLMVEA